MTTITSIEDIKVGTELFCNGYPGTVTKICDGQLKGMAEIRLSRGGVCVSLSELFRFRNQDNRIGK